MDTLQELIELEKQGWRALAADQETAKAFYSSVLADDAVMLFPGGLLIEGKGRILELMGAQPWKSFRLEQTRGISLSENVSVIVYKVTAQREHSNPYVALISSTYASRGGRWRLVLHQQTPV